MKRNILILILIAFTMSFANAQTENKNVIKFYPTSLAFGKATIGYERVINNNGSFTFNLGLPSGINPLDYAPDNPAEDLVLSSGKLSGLLVMPGYRFNFSKKGAPLGFYIETYAKYESFDMDFDAEFTTTENEVYPANFQGDYSGYGGGFQLGVQFLLFKTVTLDWSFLGLEAKSANASLTVTDKTGNIDIDELYTEIETNFSDISVIGKELEFEKGSNYVRAKAPNFFLPGFRFAFSIGISF